MVTGQLALGLAVALAIGLLVGAERERRKGSGPGRGPAGVRTFGLVGLAGGVSLAFGGEWILIATVVIIGALTTVAYWRSAARDPGLTTEIALVTTTLLGALAIREPVLASGLAVVVTVLLAARTKLHRFVRKVLTEQELHDALLLGAAALVILPLTPDRPVGPFGAINPRTVWKLVVLVMAIDGAGYVALRTLGARFGLAVAGFLSGFVSSSATIGAMGERARRHPALLPSAVAGAVFSTVATFVLLAALLATTSRPVLTAMLQPLLFGGGAAVAYAIVFAIRGARHRAPGASEPGRPFRLKTGLIFAATVSAVMLLSAAVNHWLGERGLVAATALAGFADAHASSLAAASLVAAGRIPASAAVIPILAALTTNSITKGVIAAATGGMRYALQIVPGLVLVVAAIWASALLAD